MTTEPAAEPTPTLPITPADLDCLDGSGREVLILIECQSHPVLANGDVSPVVDYRKRVLLGSLTAATRDEAIRIIDEHLAEHLAGQLAEQSAGGKTCRT